MKYFSKLLFIVGLAVGLSSCSNILLPDVPETGEVPVQISFCMADKATQTKSKVSGTETGVHSMQMVCFDANGLYLGIRNATLVDPDNDSKPYTGKIKGTVPQGTARIHFIANRGLTIPLSHTVGTQEEDVMNSEELSTIWNDEDHQEICYWGYRMEDTEDDMQRWLNPPASAEESRVYLIRDRAKVVLTYDPTGASTPVTKIEWLIHNGRERGYLAPAETNWSNTGYYKNSTVEGHTSDLISNAGINEYTDCGRYSLWTSEDENDEDNFDVAYQSTGSYTAKPQFLFDDDNTDIDNIKVILRVTYTVSGSSTTVYHVLRLNDDNQVKYDIVRNHTYYIKCSNLRPDIAYYETLKGAIDGEQFVNADVEVDRTIPDINDERYTLQIKLPNEGSTAIVLNTEESNSEMHFVLRNVSDLSEVTTEPTKFTVFWEKAQDFCENPQVSYDPATKQFVITTNVKQGKLSNSLQSEWIVVEYKYTGSDNKPHTLKRYIHVYAIDQFQYIDNPTLTKIGDDYRLSFKIPKPEYSNPTSPDPTEKIYPAGLYPIDVKFTTNTLNAYGISQSVPSYGLFGVSVEDTQKLCVKANFENGYGGKDEDASTHPISSISIDDITHWYYQQENKYWDFWFTYSIKSYDQTNEGEVNIYFKDVRSHLKYAGETGVKDVGLFMEIKYFGKIYSIPVTQ